MTSSSPSSSTARPRYDLSVNPPYQINYRAKRAGKRISATKRRVTFQFGFSSPSAIASGREGLQCRGEEHEVVLVWSHVTGKRQLFMDGREIHMSKAARGNTRFEYSWGIQGGHVMRIVANGTPPNGRERAMNQRQFDMELDGMSFFEFCKIFELGGTGNDGGGGGRVEREVQPAVGYAYRGPAYDSRDDDDEEYVEEPPVASIDLFDSQQEPSSSSSQVVSPVTQSSSQFSSAPSLVGSTISTASAASYDEFTPVEYTSNNGNINHHQASYDSISNSILCAYNSAGAAPAPADSAAPSVSRALVPLSSEGMDPVAKAMSGIVNLDDITSAPLKPLSRSPSEQQRGGAPATVPNWALNGRAPTLAEIRDSQAPGPGGEMARSQPAMMQQQQYQQPMQQQYQQQQQPMQQQQYQAQPQALAAYQGGVGAAAPSYGYQYEAQSQAMGSYSRAY